MGQLYLAQNIQLGIWDMGGGVGAGFIFYLTKTSGLTSPIRRSHASLSNPRCEQLETSLARGSGKSFLFSPSPGAALGDLGTNKSLNIAVMLSKNPGVTLPPGRRLNVLWPAHPPVFVNQMSLKFHDYLTCVCICLLSVVSIV